jgi:hypothetical protein
MEYIVFGMSRVNPDIHLINEEPGWRVAYRPYHISEDEDPRIPRLSDLCFNSYKLTEKDGNTKRRYYANQKGRIF